jgi:hypothetical protein
MVRKILSVAVAALAIAVLAGCGGGSPATSTAAAQPRTISGTVSYTGSVSAAHQIIVVATRQGEQTPAYSAVLKKPGGYTFSSVTDGTYFVIAFMDLGDDMGAPLPNEPYGVYDTSGDGQLDTVVVSGGQAVTGVDITLVDR